MKHLALMVLVAGAILAASLYVAMRAFTTVDTVISWHGWLAMGLGVTLTAVLGAGLMFLVFYSARHGHDDIDRDL